MAETERKLTMLERITQAISPKVVREAREAAEKAAEEKAKSQHTLKGVAEKILQEAEAVANGNGK